jgi:hypothetical protein
MSENKISGRFIFLLLLSSLTSSANTYVESGIPSIDSEWSGKNYLLAVQLMESGKVPIPMISDENGLAVLSRITSKENFALSQNPKVPLTLRMLNYLQISKSLTRMLKLYFDQVKLGVDLHTEIAMIVSYGWYVSDRVSGLANDQLRSIPKDDNYEASTKGIRALQSSLMKEFESFESRLSDTHFFSPTDISLFIKTMHETLPNLKQGFSPEYIKELSKKLDKRKIEFNREDSILILGMISELGE